MTLTKVNPTTYTLSLTKEEAFTVDTTAVLGWATLKDAITGWLKARTTQLTELSEAQLKVLWKTTSQTKRDKIKKILEDPNE